MKVLLIVDYDRSVLCSALLFDKVEEFKGVANRAVWVWPAGCAVVL